MTTRSRMSEKKYTATDVQSFSYYSGSQISIWFGDIWVDDISDISFQYNQEKRPIYGYASQYFDAVAKGQVFIQGGFVVNFKERGYISYIINNLPKLYNDMGARVSGSFTKDSIQKLRGIISTHLRNGTFGPQSLADITDLAKSDNFLEQSEVYEQAIWGEKIYGQDNSYKYIDTPDILQQKEFPKGFDILITYGDVSAGKPTSLEDMTTSTVKKLNGVHLTGSSQMIRYGGEPVQESYSFFARGMDDNG